MALTLFVLSPALGKGTVSAAFYAGFWRLTGRHRRGFQGGRGRRVQLGELVVSR